METTGGARVVDREVIERLRALEESGDPALVNELVRDFGQLTPNRLVQLRRYASEVDFSAVAMEARALADSCKTLGLEQMKLACDALERIAEHADTELLVTALVEVERRFIEALEALEGLDLASA